MKEKGKKSEGRKGKKWYRKLKAGEKIVKIWRKGDDKRKGKREEKGRNQIFISTV